MAAPPSSTKVLYILGTQRGGTTIAGRLAGELPGVTYVGELRKLWETGFAGGRRCGCGRSHDDCPVWSTVLPRVLRDIDPAEVKRWQEAALPSRRIWRNWEQLRGRSAASNAAQAYGEVCAATFGALAEASGARVLVDGSKLPGDARLLARVEGVKPYFLHVVRDPRGTVCSSLRRAEGGGAQRPGAAARVAGAWVSRHLLSSTLRRAAAADRFLVLRYERLIEAPNESLRAIAGLLGEPDPGEVVVDGTARLSTAHTPIGGGRFQAATVALVRDDRWRTELSLVDRWITTAMTAPLAARYGYLG